MREKASLSVIAEYLYSMKITLFFEERHLLQDDNVPIHMDNCVHTCLDKHIEIAETLMWCPPPTDELHY